MRLGSGSPRALNVFAIVFTAPAKGDDGAVNVAWHIDCHALPGRGMCPRTCGGEVAALDVPAAALAWQHATLRAAVDAPAREGVLVECVEPEHIRIAEDQLLASGI